MPPRRLRAALAAALAAPLLVGPVVAEAVSVPLSCGGRTPAMVDRRRGEQLRALALLSISLAAASTLGLARLRTRRSPSVRVGRVR